MTANLTELMKEKWSLMYVPSAKTLVTTRLCYEYKVPYKVVYDCIIVFKSVLHDYWLGLVVSACASKASSPVLDRRQGRSLSLLILKVKYLFLIMYVYFFVTPHEFVTQLIWLVWTENKYYEQDNRVSEPDFDWKLMWSISNNNRQRVPTNLIQLPPTLLIEYEIFEGQTN